MRRHVKRPASERAIKVREVLRSLALGAALVVAAPHSGRGARLGWFVNVQPAQGVVVAGVELCQPATCLRVSISLSAK